MKPIRVQDELGQYWLIFPGDPAWPIARALYLLGLREIVLLRYTIREGAYTEWHAPENMASWDVSKPVLATLLRRYVRLLDCQKVVRDRTSGLQPQEPQDESLSVAASEDHGSRRHPDG